MCDDVECPYCGAEIEVYDESPGDLDFTREEECSECGKNFAYTIAMSVHFTPHKADCLNGSPHDFKPSTVSPKFMVKMTCGDCGGERDLTKEEFKKHCGFDMPGPENFFEDCLRLSNGQI